MIRSPADTLRIARLLDVEHIECFQPIEGRTHCASFSKCFCAAWGVELPAIVANAQNDWLNGVEGKAAGWIGCDRETAKRSAEDGIPALASWKNPNTEQHGHIAPLQPSAGMVFGPVYVANAGAHNYRRCRLEQAFGALVPDFFINPA